MYRKYRLLKLGLQVGGVSFLSSANGSPINLCISKRPRDALLGLPSVAHLPPNTLFHSAPHYTLVQLQELSTSAARVRV